MLGDTQERVPCARLSARAQGLCWVSQPLLGSHTPGPDGLELTSVLQPGILTGAALDPKSQHVVQFKSSLLHEVEEADMEKGWLQCRCREHSGCGW